MDKLPPPTCEQLHHAFEQLAARCKELKPLNFLQAMEHPTWSRVIRCKASADRKEEFKRNTTRRVKLVRRINPATGQWVTQRVPGEFDQDQPQFF